jgi:acyl-CoA reductase-like NAD-dependent aldehyde dehydrogenase
VTLELGGNAAVIVEPDADLAHAVEGLTFGAFAYAGQVCLSTQRILGAAEVHDEFVARFVQRVGRLAAGDPLDEATELGPMITAVEAARVQEWVAGARRSRADRWRARQRVRAPDRAGGRAERRALLGEWRSRPARPSRRSRETGVCARSARTAARWTRRS